MTTKINKLTFGLKICLIAILITLVIDLFPSFLSGYNEVSNNTGLESRKHTVFVTQISDTVLQQHKTFTVTGIKALQIQDAKDNYTWLGFAFWVFIMVLGIYAICMFIRIFKTSFLLIKKMEALQLFSIENLPIFKGLGNALLLFGCTDIVGSITFKFYIDYKYEALVGYKPSQPIDLNFYYIILGIVVLIVAAILKETIALKQEQDLTI